MYTAIVIRPSSLHATSRDIRYELLVRQGGVLHYSSYLLLVLVLADSMMPAHGRIKHFLSELLVIREFLVFDML